MTTPLDDETLRVARKLGEMVDQDASPDEVYRLLDTLTDAQIEAIRSLFEAALAQKRSVTALLN